jgi:hypothetical protein
VKFWLLAAVHDLVTGIDVATAKCLQTKSRIKRKLSCLRMRPIGSQNALYIRAVECDSVYESAGSEVTAGKDYAARLRTLAVQTILFWVAVRENVVPGLKRSVLNRYNLQTPSWRAVTIASLALLAMLEICAHNAAHASSEPAFPSWLHEVSTGVARTGFQAFRLLYKLVQLLSYLTLNFKSLRCWIVC